MPFAKKIELPEEEKKIITVVLRGTDVDLLLFLRVLLYFCDATWPAEDYRIDAYIPNGMASQVYELCRRFSTVKKYNGRDYELLEAELEAKAVDYFVYDTNLKERRILPKQFPYRKHIVDAFCNSLQVEWTKAQRSTFPLLSLNLGEVDGFYTASMIRDRMRHRPRNQGFHCFAHFSECNVADAERHLGFTKWQDFIAKMIDLKEMPWVTSALIVRSEYAEAMKHLCFISDDKDMMGLLRTIAMSNLYVGVDGFISHLAVALRIPSIIMAMLPGSELYKHNCYWAKYINEPVRMVVTDDLLTFASEGEKIYSHVS